MVGGLFGLSGTKVETEVLLDKDWYRVGETIKVRLKCNNKNSSNDVKHFKLKLKRKVDLKGLLRDVYPRNIHESDY
jgi:hypothetical protein